MEHDRNAHRRIAYALMLLAALLGACLSPRSPRDRYEEGLLKEARAASGDPGGPPQGGVQYGQGYLWDRQTASFRTNLQTADTLTSAATLATPAFVLNGRQNLTVSARFTDPSVTCQVAVVWIWNRAAIGGVSSNVITGVSSTLTCTGAASSGFRDADGNYMAPTLNFDGNGASHARVVLVTAPATGLVNLWAGSE